jgi:hypothetical protein
MFKHPVGSVSLTPRELVKDGCDLEKVGGQVGHAPAGRRWASN